jgi:uncharacterized protein (DUF924 family)
VRPEDIIEEWFGPGDDRTVVDARSSRWFKKDPAFDAHLRDRYGALVDKAIKGPLPGWADTPAGAVAEVILLDQFTRNIHRGTARMYAGDVRALAAARAALERHADALRCVEQLFLWMPFEHAEDRAVQAECVAGVKALAAKAPADVADMFADFVDYAYKHQDVVEQFGRFPHRNAILGRENTAEEAAYLAQPGAGF